MSEEQHNENQKDDENKLIAQRREKLSKIRAQREAYPNSFERLNRAAELIAEHSKKEKAELEELAVQALSLIHI